MRDTIVEITALRKVYPGKNPVIAVDGIDLRVQAGQIYGLLGPNGAGKTTTISIATTRAVPTAGSVRIDGMDVVAQPALARRSIGVVPQYNTLDRSVHHLREYLFSLPLLRLLHRGRGESPHRTNCWSSFASDRSRKGMPTRRQLSGRAGAARCR